MPQGKSLGHCKKRRRTLGSWSVSGRWSATRTTTPDEQLLLRVACRVGGRNMARRNYRGSNIEVAFDDGLCIHATECVQGLAAVFDRGRRPWICPDNATAEQVSLVVERCPSGALTYRRLDGQPDEQTRQVTVVTAVENGPLAVRGDLLVRREDGWLQRLPRAALCRCGHSKN